MEYIALRRHREGFELVDAEGKHLGIALTLAQAQRLAAACGAALVMEDEPEPTGSENRDQGSEAP